MPTSAREGSARRVVGAALAAMTWVALLGCGGSRANEGGSPQDLPLLGSSHGGHLWATYCEGKGADAPLPADPRSLVQPGVSDGRAAHFNAFWVECGEAPPATCGEYRAGFERGKDLMEGGKLWFFGGDYTDAMITLSADQYSGLWARWGYASRPADFDQRLADRWGIPLGPARNPYPLPGEDPNATDGGTGQLPIGITQLRDPGGRYTGRLGMTCNWCHSGKVGEEADGEGLGALYGSGNPLVDIGALFGDTFPGFPLAANKTRGTGDILLYPAIAALDFDRAGRFNASLVAAPSGGSVDFPPWWNVGHRTRRFHDGSFAMDDARPVMGFFMPILSPSHLMDITNGRRWISEHDEDVRLWTEALRSPAYPWPIDTELAEAGAVLFHERDLWAPELENPVPRPQGGNGACATCHGVYSPRYAGDTRFLARPELQGIAAHRVPLAVIGTDPARAASLNDGLKDTLSYSWWGYGTADTQGACFGVPEPGGYLAPPLHGIWASAPYFHNASVPNVWEVLKGSERKAIWRRWSTPAPPGDPTAFMSFDTALARAYDPDRLGWRYDALECGDPAIQPALDCTPGEAEQNPAGNVWFAWNLSQPPLTVTELEDRKIYNTHAYSHGNQGHEFTAVLTDEERRALIEYLKTL